MEKKNWEMLAKVKLNDHFEGKQFDRQDDVVETPFYNILFS